MKRDIALMFFGASLSAFSMAFVYWTPIFAVPLSIRSLLIGGAGNLLVTLILLRGQR